MNIIPHFSTSYREARAKFLDAASARNLPVDSRLNPNVKGVDGEDLYMDIVLIGPKDASKMLFLTSGTHGVEGYCGSGCQIAFLKEGYFTDLPADTSVVMVHAMNPYGFSHDRRVNEDNVDLNRNFLDYSKPDRPTSDYSKIHPFILPEDWNGPARRAANKQLALFIEEHGMPAFQAAASGGQYQHSDGIFFGGNAPTWSHLTFQSVLRDYAHKARTACFLDFHTGLGPYGYGELISLGSQAQKSLVREWFGEDVTDPDAGTSTSAPLVGTIGDGVARVLTETEIAFIGLEYGTRDITTVLTALRADNWLYHRGDVNSPLGREIKTSIRDAFYPEADDWKQMVWDRACEITGIALSGLRQTAP